MKHVLVAAIAALALLPTPSFAAGNLMTNPASIELSLAKKDIAVVMVSHVGGGEIVIHPLGCPRSGVAFVRHTVATGNHAISQLKVSVKAQTVGSCTLHFSVGTEDVAVPVTVSP